MKQKRAGDRWTVYNPGGKYRVIVTKELPGERWLKLLIAAQCRVDVCTSTDIISAHEIESAIAPRCDGVIGQLTEDWNGILFRSLNSAGCRAYSNFAVGFNNVDVGAATKYGIPVGNTPGVLTQTTAEMAVALTLAAARRVVEADTFMRTGKYEGWLPKLFLGKLLSRKILGVIGTGRIGTSYAKMMVEAFKMSLIYFDIQKNRELEHYITAYGEFLKTQGEEQVTCRFASSIEEVLRRADVVSLHPVLDKTTHHLINAERLGRMKKDAILINASRGPVIDETALVHHCNKNPDFRVGLDVYEDEPEMKRGLDKLLNAVIVPHIASATSWTREGMAILAASNIAAILRGFPVWHDPQNVLPFLGINPPKAAPSIVNARELNIPVLYP
jgi:hydroxypyruvate reductase 1